MRWRSHRIDAKQNEREKKRLRLRHTNNVWMFCVCRLYRDEMKFMRKPMSHNHKTCVVLIFILCIGIDIWNVSAGFYQRRTARERESGQTYDNAMMELLFRGTWENHHTHFEPWTCLHVCFSTFYTFYTFICVIFSVTCVVVSLVRILFLHSHLFNEVILNIFCRCFCLGLS